jgi:hypothetical protein
LKNDQLWLSVHFYTKLPATLFKAAQTMETLEYLADGGLLIVGWHHDRQDGQAQHDFRWSGLITSIVVVR